MDYNELIAKIKELVKTYSKFEEEDFMPDPYGSGYDDGCSYVANELAELIENYEKDANEN